MQPLNALVILLSSSSLARAAAVVRDFLDNEIANINIIPGSLSQNASDKVACKPFVSTFSPMDVSQIPLTPFVGISPSDSYEATGNGLQMYLKRPEGPVARQGNVNSVAGQGATINSTFLLSHGKVTFEVKAPTVAGVVTAVIMIADGHDEIDVEILGGEPHSWQTNAFSPSPKDKGPLYGVLSSKEEYNKKSDTVDEFHNYTIDWNKDRINWSLDGKLVRTLKPSETQINGTEHYPTQASRIQLGIWDASTAQGTSEWAKGPIDWETAPSTITATVKRVEIECH